MCLNLSEEAIIWMIDGRVSEWTPGVGDGQGGLACCDSWGRGESDATERLNWTELNWCSSSPCCWRANCFFFFQSNIQYRQILAPEQRPPGIWWRAEHLQPLSSLTLTSTLKCQDYKTEIEHLLSPSHRVVTIKLNEFFASKTCQYQYDSLKQPWKLMLSNARDTKTLGAEGWSLP